MTVEDVKTHSNEWRRCLNTLETSVEDVKTHSNEWRRCRLVTSVGMMSETLFPVLALLAYQAKNTRFECSFTSSQLVSSVVSHLLNSIRV